MKKIEGGPKGEIAKRGKEKVFTITVSGRNLKGRG